MKKETTTKLLSITAGIFVAAALATLPYQNQVADAQATKRYQVVVTLTDVPANAEDLEVNATLNRALAFSDEETVSSPSEGDRVRFAFRVPSETVISQLIVCATLQSDPLISNCDQHFFSEQIRGPIRVDLAYPS